MTEAQAVGLLVGILVAVPIALVRRPRLRLVSAALLPLVGLGAYLSASPTALAVVVGRVDTPGPVMDIELTDQHTGYASLGDGSIIRLSIDDADVTWRTVVTGLQHPRGLAIAGNELYVAELGRLACDEPSCMEPEAAILEQSSGRVTRYSIVSDALVDPVRVLEGLPVANSEHGTNDLDVGPDNYLYLSVGNIGSLIEDPAAFAAIEHPHIDWLGTILRIDPTTGAVSIHARGLRNVYGLAFAPGGRLFAADNDGPAQSDWRSEELLEIVLGGNFGFPEDGTFGPFSVRTARPIGIIHGVAAAGILWMEGAVIIGLQEGIERYDLIEAPDGRYSISRPVVVDTPECLYATSIERIADDSVLVGCFSSKLLVLRGPAVRPVESR